MKTTRTIEYGNDRDLLEAVEDITLSIKALGDLVAIVGCHGELTPDTSAGFGKLIDFQCDELDFIRNSLREQIADIRENKLEIRNPERIAEWAGVSQYEVNRVIQIATGIVLGPPTANHTDQPPYTVKKPIEGFNQVFGDVVAPANQGQAVAQ